MLSIGESIVKSKLSELVGAKPGGTQCGILINREKEFTILVMSRVPVNYPNKWVDDVPGLLLYCGTDKGQTKEQKKQNLNSRLNKHVNEELFPIYVLLDMGEEYVSLGQFSRVREYDEWLSFRGKEIYRFGLVSEDVETVTMLKKRYHL